MENMKKKLLLLWMGALAIFVFVGCSSTTTTVPPTTATTTTEQLTTTTTESASPTLVIHYYRFDDNYTPWSLWLWQSQPTDSAGAQYTFNGQDDFGKTFTLSLEGTNLEPSTRLGFIVRDANWNKDVSIDRFISLTSPNENNEVHVYLVQNDQTVYMAINDVDVADKIISATFSDDNSIYFTATATLTPDKVSLYADDVLVSIENVTINGTEGSLDLVDAVDLYKKYELHLDFGAPDPAQLQVGFDGFYTSTLFNETFGYDGSLGAIYSETETTFKLWAPISEEVVLNLYTKGHTSDVEDYDGIAGVDTPYETHDMTLGEKGVWSVTISEDLNGVYYTYSVTGTKGEFEVMDPYAFTSGVNGERGMVIDFDQYDPEGWDTDVRPSTMTSYTDAIIYELHVRDFTTHETWNGTEEYRGKFLGLAESGTTYESVTTGLDHILELGVTHVQLLPIFDHGIIDETRLDDPTYYGIHDGIFNWGYMPENFNVVEGSYSTDPFNGAVRTTELKQLVNTFHENDVRVIMDVVYNHTGKSADSNFDLIMPGYYFRMTPAGGFSNGSGTGNETASERYMFRKYMVDSLLFWTNEYHLDGFRFDLMKLHDVDTMNQIVNELHAIDETILIFGEPWTGGTSMLSDSEAAYNSNLDEMPGVAVFNDDVRNGIKGGVFDAAEKGFVQGDNYSDPRVLLGVTGATAQANLSIGALPKGAWALQPTQTINYVTAHDNNTLYDKLVLSTAKTDDIITRMARQANAIILTSQGIPFLHAGVEILRTKPCIAGGNTCDSLNRYDHNSYRSPDETNQIDWNWKVDNLETFEYYKALIALRKAKAVFTLETTTEISNSLHLVIDSVFGFVSYTLTDENDAWKTIYVLHNNGKQAREITLLEGAWHVVATTDSIGAITENGLATLYDQAGGETITMAANETLIMYSLTVVDPTA